MKLFQQLLVAPAALGLIASGANAAELNINGVSDYAASADQVTSVTQFSDVYPTDWAYQALAGLVETYGCVAGYPNGTFRGNRAMTRFEAAALLNACLDRVTEVTDELRRLMAEFETELAILKGRVDGLEAKVGELEATQFSATTKLKGKTTFILGALDYEGVPPSGQGEALTFQYDTRLGLKTSFTGKDLLFTRMRVGNNDGDNFAEGLSKLDTAGKSGDIFYLDRLYYRFPVGEEFTAVVGPMARNTEALGMKPTAYTVKTLNIFGGQFGTGNVYNKGTGSFVGGIWKQSVEKGQPRLTASLSYVAEEGDDSTKGIGTDEAEGAITTQIGYGTKQWGAAFGYRYGQCGHSMGTSLASSASCSATESVDTNNYAINGFWKPDETGLIPSISAGYGFSSYEGTTIEETANWMVGFQWDKVLDSKHTFAVAFGAPNYVTSQVGADPDAAELAWEAGLKLKMGNFTVIPAVFYLPEQTQGIDGQSTFGGVVQTVFKF